MYWKRDPFVQTYCIVVSHAPVYFNPLERGLGTRLVCKTWTRLWSACTVLFDLFDLHVLTPRPFAASAVVHTQKSIRFRIENRIESILYHTYRYGHLRCKPELISNPRSWFSNGTRARNDTIQYNIDLMLYYPMLKQSRTDLILLYIYSSSD